MDTSWLEYCATEEQLKAFNDEGYLIVEDAISSEMVDALEEVADRLDAEERVKTGLAPHELLSKFRTVIEDDVLLELLDNKKVFPLLWGHSGLETFNFISRTSLCIPQNLPINSGFAKARIGIKTAEDLCRRWNVHTRDSH